MSEYRDYRRDHPGPLSVKSYQFWRKNGGEDLPTFQWTDKKVKNNKKTTTKITKKNYHKNQQKQKKTYKIYKNEIKNMNGGIVHYH